MKDVHVLHIGSGKKTAVARFVFNFDLANATSRMSKLNLDMSTSPLPMSPPNINIRFAGDSCRTIRLEGDRLSSTLGLEIPTIPNFSEQFQAERKHLIRHCEGIVVMYSVTSISSLVTALEYLQLIFTVRGRTDFPVVLVGNKCDLEDERTVNYEGNNRHSPPLLVSHFILLSEGQEIARQFSVPFFETSTNEIQTIEEPFIQICFEIRKDRLVSTRETGVCFLI